MGTLVGYLQTVFQKARDPFTKDCGRGVSVCVVNQF